MPEAGITIRDGAAYLNVTGNVVYPLTHPREVPGCEEAGALRLGRREKDYGNNKRKRVAFASESAS